MIFLALCVIAASPVLQVEIPPLIDYPNHLGRMHVLTAEPGSPAAENYVVGWRPIPNLAMDAIVPIFARTMSVVDAGRAFILLAMFLFVSGVLMLHRAAYGSFSATPLLGFLLVFNLPLVWGFLNFYFSVGLCLWVFAGWIACRDWALVPRLILFNTATGALYLSHLFGIATFAFAVMVFELHRLVETRQLNPMAILRRGVETGAHFLLPLALFLANAIFWEPGGGTLELGSWFGNLRTKGSALTSGLWFYGGITDFAIVGGFLAALVAGVATGRLSIAPKLRAPVIGLFLLTLCTPQVLTGLFMDARLGVFFCAFFVAALRIDLPLRGTVVAIGFVACAFTLKTQAISKIWRPYDRVYATFREEIRVITPGARLLSVHDIPGEAELSTGVRWRIAGFTRHGGFPAIYGMRGAVNLAILERGNFVPSLFTYGAAQPIRSADQHVPFDPVQPSRTLITSLFLAGADPAEWPRLTAEATARREHLFWLDWPAHFDYVVIFRYDYEELERTNPDPAHLEEIATSGFFDIYRVRD